MFNRIFINWKTTLSALVQAAVTIAATMGLDLSHYGQVAIVIIGAIGTLTGLFAKDK